jgi:hypothetical protein
MAGDDVRQAQGDPRRRLHDLEVLCGQRRDALLTGGVPVMTEVLHHRPGVDADRTRELARGVARAGVHGVVAVGVEQPGLHRGPARLAHHLPSQHDPLTRRRGEVLAGAGRLAEPALDARVRDRLDLGDGLESAQMGLRVPVEDDPGGQDPVRVDGLLRTPHELRRGGAPFPLQEGRDVTAGGVLRLQ